MKRSSILILSLLVSGSLCASDSYAQCSRGQGSARGPASAQFSNNLAQVSVMSRTSPNMVALQAQQYQMQRQFGQMREWQLQQMQQIALQRSAQQQSLQANRLARAEAKRAKRAARTATLKAKRIAESAVMLASRNENSFALESDRLD